MHESHRVQNEKSIEFGDVDIEGGGLINASVSNIREIAHIYSIELFNWFARASEG